MTERTRIPGHRGTTQSCVPSHERWWRRDLWGCRGDPVTNGHNCCLKFSCLLSGTNESDSTARTWFTPPEFSVHMANLFANPTVSPSKSLPLQKKMSKVRLERLDYQFRICSQPVTYVTNWALSCFVLCRRTFWRHSRNLSKVVSELLSTSK